MEDINAVFIDPQEPEVDYAELNFDDQLKHTQRIKNRLLHALVHANPDGVIPTDKDSVELMLKVADSMDKSTIAKKRVAVDEKSNNSALSILTGIAEMVSKGGNTNMFAVGNSDKPNKNTDLGELPDYSSSHALGEGEQGVITETADSFNARMHDINKEAMRLRELELGLSGNDE